MTIEDTTPAPRPTSPIAWFKHYVSDRSRIGLIPASIDALLAFFGYLALTYVFLPAVRDSSQTFYQDVLVNGIGPDRAASADFIKHGIFPSWTRDLYSGAPFAANIQHAVWYPFNAPFLFWKPSEALKIVVITSVALCATTTFLYCRHALRVSRLAALFAGLAFGFGGMSLQHVILTNQLQEISMMPLVLLAVHHALETRRLRHTVLVGVTVGIQLLAGHPEEWVYTLLALGFYVLVWCLCGVRSQERREWVRRAVGGILRVGSGLVLMVLLFGFQLFPTLQLMKNGYRSLADFDEQYPLPHRIALNSLLPDYGNVLTGENVGYIGIVGLLLAVVGLVIKKKGLRWVQVWVIVISAFGFVMALGNKNPVAKFLIDTVPTLHGFRVPSRYLLLPSFGLAIAAALGMDALLFSSIGAKLPLLRERLKMLALGLGALAVLIAFGLVVGGFSSPTEPIKWVLAALVMVGCWILASHPRISRVLIVAVLFTTTAAELYNSRPKAEYHQRAPKQLYDSSGPVLTFIKQQGGRYLTSADIARTPYEKSSIRIPNDGFTNYHDANYFYAGYATRVIGRPNTQVQDHVETILGRDGGLMPFGLYKEFFDARIKAPGQVTAGLYIDNPHLWDFNTLDFLGVRHWVVGTTIPEEEAVLHAHGFVKDFEAGYVQVFSRPQPPLARLTTDITVQPDSAKRIAALPSLDLTKQAIVEKPLKSVTFSSAPAGDVTSVHVGLTRVSMTANAARESLLVLADPWYPGWHVSVDGKDKPLVRADHDFRGVVVPAGTHTVVFSYKDSMMLDGLYLSGLTIISLAGGSFYASRRRRVGPFVADSPDTDTDY